MSAEIERERGEKKREKEVIEMEREAVSKSENRHKGSRLRNAFIVA